MTMREPPTSPRPGASAAHAVYGIFFLLGIASSLPWNVFVTAQDYFQSRLEGTPYEASFVNWFATGFNLTTLLSMLFRTVCVADRMPGAVRTILSTLVVVLAVMLGHTVLTRMPEFHGEPFFQLTMASIVVVGSANTMLQDGLLRLVSTFPPRFTQAVVSGQAMAGVVVSASNFVIMAAHATHPRPTGLLERLAADVDLNAFVYFAFVFIVVILSTLAFVILTRMRMFRHYHHHQRHHPQDNGQKHHKAAYKKTDKLLALEDPSAREKLLEDADTEDADTEADEELYLIDLAFKIRFFAGTVFLVFLMTLSVFPGLTSLLHSMTPQRGRLYRELFVPAFFILVNTGDLLGRWSATAVPALTPRGLLLASAGRFLLCPLIMLCNLQNEHHQAITEVVFRSDVFPVLFIGVCAFTNGLLSTQALMQYPRILASDKEKELGGTIMFFLLSLGLTAGSLLSFILLAMLRP